MRSQSYVLVQNGFTVDQKARQRAISRAKAWFHRTTGVGWVFVRTVSLALRLQVSFVVRQFDWTDYVGTVFSFHEDPAYESTPKGEDSIKWRAAELRNMRSNVVTVLKQLSSLSHEEFKYDILNMKQVRQPLKRGKNGKEHALRRVASVPEPIDHISLEGSSNLFYYLFEDYIAAVPILKTSRTILADLVRKNPADSPTQSILRYPTNFYKSNQVLGSARHYDNAGADIIPRLHNLSRELRQLQHLFEGYKSLIQRIVPRIAEPYQSGSSNAIHQLSAGVKLSASARHRFERLGDRLQLLMLNTIRGYLEEKTALSDTVR